MPLPLPSKWSRNQVSHGPHLYELTNDHRDTIRNKDEYQRQMRLILTYLKVPDFQGDLTTTLDSKLEGSCLWLTESKDFNKWHQEYPDTPSTFWLSGNPGTGKSVLAGHVAKYLPQCNVDCSNHFFKQNNKTTNSRNATFACVSNGFVKSKGAESPSSNVRSWRASRQSWRENFMADTLFDKNNPYRFLRATFLDNRRYRWMQSIQQALSDTL